MTLLQKYFWKQALWPLLITLGALTALAILTQSLSTLDLIVENRQSALTFLRITFLAIPQLVAIILPLAVFIGAIYALNRLTVDSEMTVAKSVGFSPWEISNPLVRLASIALIIHLFINLVVQPLSFRQMRQEVLSIRTDIAAQMVRAGEFVTPTPGLTFYAREVQPNGQLKDVIIRDARSEATPATYIAKSGDVSRTGDRSILTLENGFIQQKESAEETVIRPLSFDRYQLNLSEILAFDTTLRLKPSDMFLHELLISNEYVHFGEKYMQVLRAEGHARLSAPLYNIMLVLLALCFLIRGPLQRVGYGQRIAICAVTGFGLRLTGFALASSSETNPAMNYGQYILPIVVILICIAYLLNRNRATGFRGFAKNPLKPRRGRYANA